MDISDISKVATRKRMNTDAEKLREKVSRETAKIIKLKVAQDTAYWDLKERLQQLESNHERLQQNMVEVQMQHEAISGQYQEELRLRPDTLNKLGGTREICDVLEEYGERLRRTVARCRFDQQALGTAYTACGAQVRRLATDAARAKDLAKCRASEARAAVERYEGDARRLTLSAEQLGAARARCDVLEEVRRELAERLERYAAEIRRREESAASIQETAVQLQRKLEDKTTELTRTIAAHGLELQAARSNVEQEIVARRECEHRSTLLQQQLDAATQRIDTLTNDYQEATAVIERLNIELASVTRDKNEMDKLIREREQQVSSLKSELALTKNQICSLETEKLAVDGELKQALERCERETGHAEEMSCRLNTLQTESDKAKATHDEKMAELTQLITNLRTTLSDRDRDLTSKTDTITQLMGDLKAEAEGRARAEAAISTTRQQLDAEKTAGDTSRADLNATIQRLETTIQGKIDEISTQKTVILEIRGEKDRLQERIRAMQSTINNIQQELTGRVPGTGTAPAPEREKDAMLYSYLSDGSVDSDALDVLEVNRRFEALARGERSLPPLRVPRSHNNKKSLSHAKKESKLQSRRFFKTKLEGKVNKLKE